MKRLRIFHIYFAFVCSGTLYATAAAQVTLYDNLRIPPNPDPNKQYVNAPPRWFAQQFQMDTHQTVGEVTVRLSRQGNPQGSVTFEIWDDDGNAPGEKVSELGIIEDVQVIPISLTDFVDYTFHERITELSPNEAYWVVADFGNMVPLGTASNSIAWAVVGESNETTSGTANASASNDSRWIDLARAFGEPDPLDFVMSVSTGGLLGDFNNSGQLDAIDIDMLSSRIRLDPDDRSFDLNNDAILTQADRDVWVHDLANTYFGDSNLDGEFNSGDLIEVFKAGEYEDNISLNSTWAEGDWNGDGDFESGDLIVAFQDGGFEAGPIEAVAAIPEPSSWILLSLGLLGIGRIRKQL